MHVRLDASVLTLMSGPIPRSSRDDMTVVGIATPS
jgi:hypothetical protein